MRARSKPNAASPADPPGRLFAEPLNRPLLPMPTLDWLNRADAFTTAARVPYRLLEPVSAHGDGNARNLLIQGDNLRH